MMTEGDTTIVALEHVATGWFGRTMRFANSRPWRFAISVIGFGLVLVGIRVLQWQFDPKVFFLSSESRAKWIRPFNTFHLSIIRAPDSSPLEEFGIMFRCDFELHRPVSNPRLRVQAFRRCRIWLDADPSKSPPLFSSDQDLNHWKNRHEILVNGQLNPGRHQLFIMVRNLGAHCCLLTTSPDLPVETGRNWLTSVDLQRWNRAVLVDNPETTIRDKLKREGYPDVVTSFQKIWPWLAAIFVASFVWSFRIGPIGQIPNSRYRIRPSQLRWGLLAAWVLLSINNFWRVDPETGYDIDSHVDYVKFIVERRRLPLATDGWQTFQSPLAYLLASPIYWIVAGTTSSEFCVKFLRLLPLLCGMAQIEIIYRVACTVFPDKDDLKAIATTVGGLMPMNISMSQVFGNEPIAGCFTSLLILLCVSLIMNPAQHRTVRFFLLMGMIWGLALLSKVTPLLLGPLIFLVIVAHNSTTGGTSSGCLFRCCTVLIACTLIAGWYYLRNMMLLGRPFIGGWDWGIGIQWWQDPSYRTWKQLTSFGAALRQPIYSGSLSFWDSIYSSMWTDGFLSGRIIVPIKSISWNIEWMETGAWLGLVPSACILFGVSRIGSADLRASRYSLLFAVATVGIYLAAMLDLYVHVPIYSGAKASYMLGLLPCFGILAAAGAAPLIRSRVTRAILFSTLCCWATAGYITYFCVH